MTPALEVTAVTRCSSGVVWCQGDVIPQRGWHQHRVSKWLELRGTSGPVQKEIWPFWWAGHSTASLEWQGQLKAHHQAHDPQSQLGNVCDSFSFPVLVTHILNPCIHLLLQRRPLILNQLHHCCRALFIHLFRPMFIYGRPIRRNSHLFMQESRKRPRAYIWILHVVWFIFLGYDLLSSLLLFKISTTRDPDFKTSPIHLLDSSAKYQTFQCKK